MGVGWKRRAKLMVGAFLLLGLDGKGESVFEEHARGLMMTTGYRDYRLRYRRDTLG